MLVAVIPNCLVLTSTRIAVGILAALLSVAACGGGGGSGDGDDQGGMDAPKPPPDSAQTPDGSPDSHPPLPPPDGPDAATSNECRGLRVVFRDFKSSHSDFGEDDPHWGARPSPGLVAAMLSADQKPVFVRGGSVPVPEGTSAGQITSADTFAQWYADVPGVNLTIPQQLTLQENSPGVYGFESSKFYPIDGMGWMDTATGEDGNLHNFLFTTEIHTRFKYHSNQTFSFRGDDDLWLFINGRLAIDLGGVHMPAEQVVNLGDIAATFGLVEGQTYPMDIFHAERRPNGSNFKVQTSIDCFVDPG